MNAYIVQERDGEYAMLVFARTAQRARSISFGTGWCGNQNEEWTDWQARRLRDLPAHLAELDTGKEQVIDNPPSCIGCGMWGGHPRPNDTCSHCYEDEYEESNTHQVSFEPDLAQNNGADQMTVKYEAQAP